MSTHTQSREPTRRYVRDSNRRKVVRSFDLNVPPVEDAQPEGSSASVHLWPPQQAAGPVDPQHGLQAAANVLIDVEAIEDEVLYLSSGFPQARNQPRRRRRPSTVIIDEDIEVHAGSSGIFAENLMATVSLNSHNKRERIPANRMIIDCEVYSTFKDNAKRKNVMTTCPEPPKVVPKEPTFNCPVCMNELKEACSTICGHIFCQDCIKLSIQKMKKCPTCRKPLTMKSFHRVYLPTSN